jgi:acetolactate decarboxylase
MAMLAAMGSSSRANSPPAAGSEPKTFGMLHEVMMMGKTDPKVTLSELPQKHLYAVGALSGLRGEVAVIDGVTWLAYGSPDGRIKVETRKGSDEKATLLVASTVSRWQRVTLAEDVPFSKLDAAIEALAKSKGVDVGRAFPVMVEGSFVDIHWHVLKGAPPGGGGHSHGAHHEMAISRISAQGKGTLVGFFSTKHQGVFTHMGSNTHFHVVLPKEKITGHVDSVGLEKGNTVLLPR